MYIIVNEKKEVVNYKKLKKQKNKNHFILDNAHIVMYNVIKQNKSLIKLGKGDML